jgi:hypothetical protein
MIAFCRKFWHEFLINMRIETRIYFAPFVGTYRGIRAEYADIERQRMIARDQLPKENSQP